MNKGVGVTEDNSFSLEDRIQQQIEKHEFAAFIEAKNGVSPCKLNHKVVSQVKKAREYLSKLVPDAFFVGGVGYVWNRGDEIFEGGNHPSTSEVNPSKVPDEIDLLVHSPNYEDRHMLSSVEEALDSRVLKGPDKSILRKILDAREKDGMEFDDFFHIYSRDYWDTISDYFPESDSRNEFVNNFSAARGYVMELYVAAPFKESVDDGLIEVRYHFPRYSGHQGDVDILVVCDPQDFISAVKELPLSRMNYHVTKDCRKRFKKHKKIKRRERKRLEKAS